MKLLFDENLSRRLVQKLDDLFYGSRHVSTAGLLTQPDSAIWEYARIREFAIVSADSDFYDLAVALGPPPKMIWLRGCDYPTAIAEQLIRSQAIRIGEFLKSEGEAVLILTAERT